ncbi:MAG TPA: anti-sigma factor [bacterium]|jgi:hypothetical protein|nr:anti-sigma factor [bacterium]
MLHWLAHRLGLNRCPQCETLVDYALDGLPETQQDSVRKHLDDCPPCREQVRDFWQVREGLGLCAKQQDIPQGFQAKVLARLAEEEETPFRAVEIKVQPFKMKGWPRFWVTLGPLFALMSVVMTVVAAGALISRGRAADNPLASLSDAVLSDPHAAKVTLVSALSGGAAGSDASGNLVLCPGMDHAVLRCQHLAPCADGQNYGLWMQAPGQPPRRLARFVVDSSTGCSHLLQLDRAFQATGAVDFMVKRESAQGGGDTWLKGSVQL